MKKKSKAYIIIFMFFLILPSVCFYTIGENVSNTENRELTNIPRLNGYHINQFIKDFENYYNDNLPYKNSLVKLYNIASIKVFNELADSDVIIGDNNFLFYKGEDNSALNDYLGLRRLDENALNTTINKMLQLQSICERRKLKFVIMICPNKEKVYSQYMPRKYTIVNEQSRADQIQEVCLKNNINFSYPIQILKNQKYQTYKKYDTHWNQIGAFFGSQKILDMLGMENYDIQDFDMIEKKNLTGDLANMISLAEYYSDDIDYEILYKNDIKYNLKNIDKETNAALYFQQFESGSNNESTLFFYGDSFANALIPYLAKEFKESYFSHRYDLGKSFITPSAGDTIVLESVERGSIDIDGQLDFLIDKLE